MFIKFAFKVRADKLMLKFFILEKFVSVDATVVFFYYHPIIIIVFLMISLKKIFFFKILSVTALLQ